MKIVKKKKIENENAKYENENHEYFVQFQWRVEIFWTVEKRTSTKMQISL